MAFDGIPKPAQYSPGGPLNPYAADNAARVQNAKTPKIKKAPSDQGATPTYKELPHYDTDEKEDTQRHLTEEEYEQIMLFARLRGIMNLALDKGEQYQFQVNPETALVDVIAVSTGRVMISMTAVELMEMTQRIHRYAGVLTDRNG